MLIHVHRSIKIQVPDFLTSCFDRVLDNTNVVRLEARLAATRSLALTCDGVSDRTSVASRWFHLDRAVHDIGCSTHRGSLFRKSLESCSQLWVSGLFANLPLLSLLTTVLIQRG